MQEVIKLLKTFIFQELEKTCYFDVLFVHKEAKAFPYWDKNLSEISFQDNSNLT